MDIFKKIKNIADVSSILEKKKLLKQYESDIFKQILKYTYDPYIQFYIRGDNKKIKYSNNEIAQENYDSFFKLLDKLKNRELTGNAAINAINEYFQQIAQDQQILFTNILNKDLRCNLGAKIINSIFKNLISEYSVMLADSINNGRQLNTELIESLNYPVIADMKEDGVRATYQQILRTRNGKEIVGCEHILEEIQIIQSKYPNIILDGELEAATLNATMQQLYRKKNQDMSNFKYVVFDCLFGIEDKTLYFERRKTLEKIFSEFTFKHIQITATKIIKNSNELIEYFESVDASGKEGLVIKTNSIYEWKRSKNWLKMKKFDSLDLPLCDIIEGSGKLRNKMGALVVLYKDKKVNIGSGFSEEERESIWLNREQLLNKETIVEVSYKEISIHNSLQFPTFIRFREDK